MDLNKYLENLKKGSICEKKEFCFPDGCDGIEGLFYTVNGKYKVFAFMGKPKTTRPKNGYPAVVLVHGGDGCAYFEWVKKWTDKGYVAIAPDFDGNMAKDLDNRKENNVNGGPKGYGSFKDMKDNPWTYFSVSSIVSAIDVLCDDKDVDMDRIAISGISWGGVLSLMALSVEKRIKVASVFYSSGYLLESKFFKDIALRSGIEEKDFDKYNALFDPQSCADKISVPILFIAGADDVAFTMEGRKKTTELIKSNKYFSYRKNFPHSHTAGRECIEAIEFTDCYFLDKDYPQLEYSINASDISIANATEYKWLKIVGTNEYYNQIQKEWEESEISDGKVLIPNFKYFFIYGENKNGLICSTCILDF